MWDESLSRDEVHRALETIIKKGGELMEGNAIKPGFSLY